MKPNLVRGITLFLLWAAVSPAAVVAISEPNGAYLATTTKIDISGLTFNAEYDSITDQTLTVTFSSPMLKRGPVPTGWSTWSEPPLSESATPHVLASNGVTVMSWTLNQTVGTFGFELEPNQFSEQDFTVDFVFSLDNVIVGTISRVVHGLAGARLFAAQTTDVPFDRVDIMGPGAFGVAQIRYALLTLISMDIKPGTNPNRVNLKSRGMLPVAVMTTRVADGDPVEFDAADVNPSTLTLGPADASPWRSRLADVDDDGDLDLLLHFDLQELGLSCGATEITLRGETYDGTPILGIDSIETAGCIPLSVGRNLQP